MKATLKLFNALPIEVKGQGTPSKRVLEKTIKLGFIFSPEVVYNYPNLDELTETVEKIIGISGEKANASFHKSWEKVREASMEQLVIEQIIHYLTTYEGMGNTIFIPEERLNIPNLDSKGIRLTVIKGYNKAELKEKLLVLLDSGIALKPATTEAIVNVALFVGINGDEIAEIKNKEVRVILFDYLGLIPRNPIEFLRFAIYQVTDETLIIKSKELIEKIKENTNFKLVKYFDAYEHNNGLNRLAEIFYRFKPLWLAFRTNPELKKHINKIRRLANSNHKPMPEDYLNTITAKIKSKDPKNIIYTSILKKELDKVNIFRKIRLAYALKFRTKDVDSILYRIRNGKAYATDFYFKNKASAQVVLDNVLDSIVEDISKDVKDKTIYIPDYINYALPTTEKQFTGNFPAGTYVSVPQDMIVGIHWTNVKHQRIDLDLSLLPVFGKFGWDSSYRADDGSILFSGDIVDAPNGATELFYVEKQGENSSIMMVNYYNYDENVTVPFKIIVAKEKTNKFISNYMVNPNNILTVVPSEISQKQKILGLLVTTESGNKFYFVETSIGKSITSSNADYVSNSRKYLVNYYRDSIELEDILMKAGAIIFGDNTNVECDIDLSPENLEKDTILNLLKKGE